jgi:DNA-directed RNA polymerase specialized sigma subunit
MRINSIILNYINKKSIAIAAIKDRRNMQKIVETMNEKIHDKMPLASSSVIDGMPRAPLHQHNADNKLIEYICMADVLKERHSKATEFLNWFMPAWNLLSEQERYILDEFYAVNNLGVAKKIAAKLNFSKAHVYWKKKQALSKFVDLLI